VSRPTVLLWRGRYEQGGTGALEDMPRSGRPAEIDPLEIVIATLEPPPARLGVTHWSTRLLAAELGISNATVAQTWQRYDLQPWRRQTFRSSTDPGTGSQGPRCRGPVPGAAAERDRAVRG
jgi:hypothetical protein